MNDFERHLAEAIKRNLNDPEFHKTIVESDKQLQDELDKLHEACKVRPELLDEPTTI